MQKAFATQKIEINTRTVVKTVLLMLGLLMAWYLRAVFFMLFFAFILYSSFNPVVNKLEKLRIPRRGSIIIIYFIVFVVISIIFVIGANAIIEQVENLSSDFENIVASFIETITKAFPWLEDRVDPDQISKDIVKSSIENNSLVSSNTVSSAFGVLSSVGSGILAVFVVIMVSVYMMDRKNKFYEDLVNYLPKKYRKEIMDLMKRIETRLGAWFLGQLSLMLVVGFVTWVGVSLPGLFFESYTLDQYALPIALIAGLLEAVPNIGPSITVLIAIIVAVGSGNLTAGDTSAVIIGQSIYVAILGLLIQNLEAMFLVPIVMKKAVGVDPIVTILGIIAALSLFGIIGALLIIPVIATGQIVFEFYRERQVSEN